MIDNFRKLYIDTNVLINYCTEQPDEVAALNYLFRVRRKEVLFTSSLAIVQTISNLQTKKKVRKAFSREETMHKIEDLLSKITLINLTSEDISEGMKLPSNDIEDNIHYILSNKMKCNAIVTNNTSDYILFTNVGLLKPIKNILAMKVK